MEQTNQQYHLYTYIYIIYTHQLIPTPNHPAQKEATCVACRFSVNWSMDMRNLVTAYATLWWIGSPSSSLLHSSRQKEECHWFLSSLGEKLKLQDVWQSRQAKLWAIYCLKCKWLGQCPYPTLSPENFEEKHNKIYKLCIFVPEFRSNKKIRLWFFSPWTRRSLYWQNITIMST